MENDVASPSSQSYRFPTGKTWVTSYGLIDVEPGHRGKTAINIKTALEIELEQISEGFILAAKGFDETPTPTLAQIASQGEDTEDDCVTDIRSTLFLEYPVKSWPNLASAQAKPSKPVVKRTPVENILHQLKTGQPSDNPLVNAWGFGSRGTNASKALTFQERINMSMKREPAFCSTCYCLDVRKVPVGNEKQWTTNLEGGIIDFENKDHDLHMRREYNIPAGHVTRELFIKNTELEASARGGCVFCRVIAETLGSFRNTWKTQESFISLHLATNLPVVVCWQKGVRYNTGPVWEDSLEAIYDYDFNIHAPDYSKPMESDLEFEIYRPDHSKVLKVQGALSDWTAQVGLSKDSATHAGAISCFNFISSHATTCLRTHPNCGPRKPRLPDRVLHIAPNNTGEIKLIETHDTRAQYVALSYCWGPTDPDTFLTDAATLSARKAGFTIDDLPRLFVGVINIARMLGIAYVWIDRLCIIQGDTEDFATQAPKMGEYYGKATLTIAAASASSEEDDLLIDRDMKWASKTITVQVAQLGSFDLHYRERPHILGSEFHGGYYGKISTRAWTWQERLLAARTIFFTPSGLKFECHQHSIWETFPEHLTAPSWSSQLDRFTDKSWSTLIQEFTKRNITRSSDRLPAITSVMTRIAETHVSRTPLWGMWRETLHTGIMWSVDGSGKYSGLHACHVHPEKRAPSWSWASVEGPVQYDNYELYTTGERTFHILDLNAETDMLKIVVHAIMVTIKCEIETKPNGELSYHYSCMSVRERDAELDLGKPFGSPVRADVALRPVSFNKDGTDVESIVRVLYGEELPRETWESQCLCVLVSKQSRKWGTALLLGEMEGERRVYERIGLMTALPPEMFDLESWWELVLC